ncbi:MULTISPECIES: hypothetical protein [Pontibacillus]|uniref:DUF3953 domain-containing protein n=1 Tax=Pontibacillus chungwhensis TaxID=265426 RepID=A0ABY8UZ98_9BACI|nr:MULTISPECIES: hypothetical protein [Pontibacillus]MCD5324224.1 hypothetical protein [Pontibacillus sp. HN14]WIF97720.1 hypothetical protein QNI29_18640 [Pontibacillus chungwhensis]
MAIPFVNLFLSMIAIVLAIMSWTGNGDWFGYISVLLGVSSLLNAVSDKREKKHKKMILSLVLGAILVGLGAIEIVL